MFQKINFIISDIIKKFTDSTVKALAMKNYKIKKNIKLIFFYMKNNTKF